MNKRKRLVIPVLLGILCICLFPVTGYAAESSQSMELTLEVPEKPDAQIETSAGAKTGDDMSVAGIAVLAILAVLSLGICAVLLVRQRRKL